MSAEHREPFWVEQLDRHGTVVSRQRVHDGSLSVGRSYENDLIIDDPYVAPAHLKIGYDADGVLWIEDLASHEAKGDQAQSSTRMLVGSEASIRIGQTTLRVRTRAFAVPPAISMTGSRTAGITRSDSAMLLLCASILIAMSLVSVWFKQTGEFKVAVYLAAGVFLPLLVLAWAGAWALVTRIVASHAQFTRHALIVFAFLLGIELIDLVTDVFDYSLRWSLPQLLVQIAASIILGCLVFAHVTVVVPRRRKLASVILSLLVAIGVGSIIAQRLDSDRPQPQRISPKLMPPFLLLKQPVAPDAYFKDVEALKAKLDEARKKEPSSSSAIFDDYD